GRDSFAGGGAGWRRFPTFGLHALAQCLHEVDDVSAILTFRRGLDRLACRLALHQPAGAAIAWRAALRFRSGRNANSYSSLNCEGSNRPAFFSRIWLARSTISFV